MLTQAVEQKYIDEKELIHIKSWRLDPANWK
jgi:hypothetical protein